MMINFVKGTLNYPLSVTYFFINISYLMPENFVNIVLLLLFFFSLKSIDYRSLFIIIASTSLIFISTARGIHYFGEVPFLSASRLLLVVITFFYIHQRYKLLNFHQLQLDGALLVIIGGILAFIALINFFTTHALNLDFSSVLFDLPLQKYSFRLTGWHGNPNNNAFYIGSALVIALGVGREYWKSYHRIAFLLIVVMIFASGSRGAIIGVVAIAPIFLMRINYQSIILISIVIPVFMMNVYRIDLTVLQNLGDRLFVQSIGDLTATQSRGEIWSIHWRQLSMSFENLIFGFGLPGYVGKVTDSSLFRLIGSFGILIGFLLFCYASGMVFLFQNKFSKLSVGYFLFMFVNLLVNDWIMTKIFAVLIAYSVVNHNLKKAPHE